MTPTHNPLEILITKAAHEFITEFEDARALFKDEDAHNKLTHAGDLLVLRKTRLALASSINPSA